MGSTPVYLEVGECNGTDDYQLDIYPNPAGVGDMITAKTSGLNSFCDDRYSSIIYKGVSQCAFKLENGGGRDPGEKGYVGCRE